MVGNNETPIEESHLELIAEHGHPVALIVTVNLDANQIMGAFSFHEYDGTIVLQSGSLNSQMGRLNTYNSLLDYYGDAPDVVYEKMDDIIQQQEHSDSETRFTWELVSGTTAVQENNSLLELLETVVNPDRLDPEFDIPEDKAVGIIDTSFEEHDILTEAIEYRAGVPIDSERHRGQTYLIGLTDDYAKTIGNAIHALQQEYSEGGHYDAAETAEKLESKLLRTQPTTVMDTV